MKNLILLTVVAFTAFSFVLTERASKYPEGLSEEVTAFLDKEFIRTTENSDLRADIQTKFFNLFDEVDAVNVQYSERNGYYYLVMGTLKGVQKIELLKVEEEDVEKEIYSYIDFSHINVSASTTYCRKGNGNPLPVCPTTCDDYPVGSCIGIICGVAPACLQQ
ncbi:hypothetical protein C900_00805 [Fulvivirga imtechensis AK7]|uniref:Uncharacterized protein n=1 Tax=Fulvivirga imtechensis AK7 TaxID=1237149 RepID=L8JYY2_9BACT|nr:hypothetical protein [Fulvivirga imtechensis]ELR72844.1 hypothetical protein C900_00805 [Fulvivirga imtechensis AK7]